MFRKGQAAMEFLLTYGWAILVVLVVIGVLASFGILNVGNLLPERCTIQTGISCSDFIVTPAAGVRLGLKNGLGKGIYLVNVSAGSQSPATTCQFVPVPAQFVANGAETEVQLTCNPVISPQLSGWGKKSFDLFLVYYFEDSTATFTHTSSGDLRANIE